jgi:hypothetical protein
MDVPGSGDRFYIGFLEKPDELEARFILATVGKCI